jgi:hypothetical protein
LSGYFAYRLRYDFGKTLQDKAFKTTRHLDAPPLLLQAAVGRLRANYEIDGHEIKQNIDNVLKLKPRLKGKYQRPDSVTDLLYRHGYPHLEPSDDCVSCCGLHKSDLIIREPRAEFDDDPKVHYGLIASANQLMKDAVLRDRLAKENGVLCFEMEAAGLMNHFKCLVIRGICDYADSHKNKQWQGYAAMSAAAYTKDLLSVIAPNKILAEGKMNKMISDS